MMDYKKFLQPKYLIIGGIAVVAGLFIATKFFRPSNSKAAETVEVTPVLQPYAVDSSPDVYDVTKQPAPTPVPGAPTPSPGGKRDDHEVPMPSPDEPIPPPGPPPCPPGYHRNTKTGKCEPFGMQPQPLPAPTPQPQPLPGTPRHDPTPSPPQPRQPTPNVPGGFPADCRGVAHRPSDHPGADITALVRSKGGNLRALDYVLEWTLLGVAPPNVPLGLSRFANWTNNPVNWIFINATRRNRGLKALTTDELTRAAQSYLALANRYLGKDSKLSQSDVQQFWNQWHLPYLCG